MLRIKDGVGSKELEKFGFKYEEILTSPFYIYSKEIDDPNQLGENLYVIIECDSHEIYYIGQSHYICDTLYDLIKAGLVQKDIL